LSRGLNDIRVSLPVKRCWWRPERRPREHQVAGDDEAVYGTFANQEDANRLGRSLAAPGAWPVNPGLRLPFVITQRFATRFECLIPRTGQQLEIRDGNGADTDDERYQET
jgi:hypothetical protein